MAKYEPKHRDKVKVKGRGSRVYRILALNTNSAMVESTSGDYESSYVSRDDLTKATPPKPKAD